MSSPSTLQLQSLSQSPSPPPKKFRARLFLSQTKLESSSFDISSDLSEDGQGKIGKLVEQSKNCGRGAAVEVKLVGKSLCSPYTTYDERNDLFLLITLQRAL